MSFILAVIALVWVYKLSNRVDDLELRAGKEVFQNPQTPKPTVAATAASPEAPVTPITPIATSSPQTPYKASEPGTLSRFIAWVQVDFMVKLGAFLLLCALGWFVSYAFMNDLIGEAGRIVLGLVTGTAFLLLGYWRIRHEVHQGGIFTVLGSTTILLTVYAARELYDFFTPLSALGLMFLSTAFVALVAVRFNSQRLALAGLFLASIAPLFTNSPYPDVIERFTYLLVIVFGSLWVVYLRGWSTLTLGALLVVIFHGLPYLGGSATGDRDVVLLFVFVFTAIFFIANILGLIANENEENRMPHLYIAAGTGLYLIVWIFAVAPEEWQSLLFSAWMLVFSIGSYVVHRVIERPEAFYLYGGTSIALLGAATASELQGHALTIAYTLEIGVLVCVASVVLKRTKIARVLAFLFVIPVGISSDSIGAYDWMKGIFHGPFFELLVLMGTLLVSAVALRIGGAMTENDDTRASTVLFVVSGFYATALVWLVLHGGDMLTYDTATLFALLVYTVVGIACFTWGTHTGVKALRYTGAALITLAVGRLLVVEVWDMELTGRIITFGLIGLLLISTAFLKRKKDIPINQ